MKITKKKISIYFLALAAVLLLILVIIPRWPIQALDTPDEDELVPKSIPANSGEKSNIPSDSSALGGYNVLIADRGNNRLIEVTPDKKIVWEYQFHLPAFGLGADDAFFTNGGRDVIVNLEEYHLVQIIDYKTKKVVWEYGHPGVRGGADGYLSNPDDAYRLPNGDVIVADIKNCRVIEINPAKKIVHQYGHTQTCADAPGFLNKPNGDTPLPNGHILISNIRSHNLIELDQNWQPVFSLTFPLSYPSDPQLTKTGHILICEYLNPGKILEISKNGQPVWEFTGDGSAKLNKPSLAIELPNGHILANDDYNHRVIVIDKNTKKIIWQYGITGKPGRAGGQLNVPDGVDFIKHQPVQAIGAVSRHESNFLNQHVILEGYLLKRETGYIIVSDENGGAVGRYDLPIKGIGLDQVQTGRKYVFNGKFFRNSSAFSNDNFNYLELIKPPEQSL